MLLNQIKLNTCKYKQRTFLKPFFWFLIPLKYILRFELNEKIEEKEFKIYSSTTMERLGKSLFFSLTISFQFNLISFIYLIVDHYPKPPRKFINI
jgi:hypothetical protein